MRKRRRAVALAMGAISLVAAPLVAIALINPAALNSVRIEHRGPTQELHFGFDASAPRLDLSAHGSELWIDLDRARIEVPPRPLFGQEADPIKSVRVINAGGGGRSRIVLEVAGKADYAIARIKREIILRVAAAGADPHIASPILVHNDPPRSRGGSRAARTARAPTRLAMAEAPAAAEYRYNGPAIVRPPEPQLEAAAAPANAPGHPLVMIDPGHGGYDPGTQSAAGVAEKDLALQIAVRLKAALEARGIRATLTRSTDAFISLAERTRIANAASADLFVSVHLNSSPNPATTGIEVYYLNNTTDRATIRLARMENGGGAGYGTADNSNLNYILADLRQNYKASEAAALARMIDAQTVADLDAGLGLDVNPLGAKMGPFYVLVGAHMPAVLVECGFLSNAGEARQVAGEEYQDLLAGAVAAAIGHYFNADLAVGNL